MDKVVHLLTASFLGASLSTGRQAGLCIGFALLLAWEVWQGSTASGSVEPADVLAGACGLTWGWTLFLRQVRRPSVPRPTVLSSPSAWEPLQATLESTSAVAPTPANAFGRLDRAA
ncbi:MAG: hypothetical protein QGI46_13605 [Planctomycetota bacterium]|jgi:hypothetical protein|nr:hypothetical protein [Planctomycetota bacterium]